MNHPFFYLSIAALGLFYGILFLSLLRGVMRGHNKDGSNKASKKPSSPTRKYNLIIKSIVFAHWVTGPDAPATPLTLLENPLSGLTWTPSLSVN